MTIARQRLGRFGEDVACRHLSARGFAILGRNCRTRFGEIDIVALDGDALVFAEVKTTRASSGLGPETPVLAVGRRKQMQIRRLARAWLAENRPPPSATIRFDVIGVSVGAVGGGPEVDHLRGAF